MLPVLQQVIELSGLPVLRPIINLFPFVLLYSVFNGFLIKREGKHVNSKYPLKSNLNNHTLEKSLSQAIANVQYDRLDMGIREIEQSWIILNRLVLVVGQIFMCFTEKKN